MGVDVRLDTVDFGNNSDVVNIIQVLLRSTDAGLVHVRRPWKVNQDDILGQDWRIEIRPIILT